MPRTTRDKLAIFRACFGGLPHVYGTYDVKRDRVRQVKAKVTDRVLLHHLQGLTPYGVFLLVDDQTRAAAVDFDEPDTWYPLQFVRQAKHYGISTYVERSKKKGWHAWVFFKLPGVSAAKARLVIKAILDDIDRSSTEVFPKQDKLTPGKSYGNFINAPLFGALVPERRSIFVDPARGFEPYPDQWDLLEGAIRVTERQLEEIIEINDLGKEHGLSATRTETQSNTTGGGGYGLPPCARRMLVEGVDEYQRVACFRLAVQLRRAGLPQDITIASLRTWAAKNRPRNGNRTITDDEINAQASCAYAKYYRGCGCEEPAVIPFCDATCPLKRRRAHYESPRQSRSRTYAPKGASNATPTL